MKKSKAFHILFLLFIIALCILGAVKGPDVVKEIGYETGFSFGIEPPLDPLNAELADMVSRYQKGEISVIDLSKIATFSWEKVYIFKDYATASVIDPIVGKSWRNIPRCSYAVGITPLSDAEDLLIFMDKNTVVYCMFNPIQETFNANDETEHLGIPRDKALFIIQDGWLLVTK